MSPTCEYPPQQASEEQGDAETSSPRKWVVALRALAQPTSNLCCCQCDQGQASQPAQTPSQAKRNEGKKSDFNQPSLSCNPNTKSEFHQDNVELFSLWRARSAISEISWEAARMRFCKTTAVLCKRKNLESSRSLQLCQLDRKTEKQKLHWKSTVFYSVWKIKIFKKTYCPGQNLCLFRMQSSQTTINKTSLVCLRQKVQKLMNKAIENLMNFLLWITNLH